MQKLLATDGLLVSSSWNKLAQEMYFHIAQLAWAIFPCGNIGELYDQDVCCIPLENKQYGISIYI